jgi:hypothetical protein
MAKVDPSILLAVASALDIDGELATYRPLVGGSVEIPVVVRPGSDEVGDLFTVGARRPGWRVRLRQSDLAERPVRGDRIDVRGLRLRVRYFDEDPLAVFWRVSAHEFLPTAIISGTFARPPLLAGVGLYA